MAFKQAESSSSGSIPFFADWEKEINPDYKTFLVGMFVEPKLIKSVQSGKGFMINFDDEFMIFIWKNSTIGKILKRMIQSEEGNLPLILFTETKKGISYDFGFDDEIEVALTEDKFEEGIYYCEVTNGNKPPIAPNDYRKFLSNIPIMSAPPVTKLTPTKSSRPSTKTRSDGGA